MSDRPEPAPFEPVEAHRRHARTLGHAYQLIGPWHRRALQVWRACRDDVFLLNPMGDGKHLHYRLLPEGITIAMAEADVPESERAATRRIVKMLHAIDGGAGADALGGACVGSGCGDEPLESWRDVCPPGAFNCSCRAWFAEAVA